MICKRSWIYSITTTVLFAIPLTIMLVTGTFFIVSRSLRDLELTAIQTGKMLGAFLDANVNQLEVLASNHVVCDPMIPIRARLDAIEPYADISRIRNIFITDRNGTGFGIDGSTHDFSRERYFTQTMRGSIGIARPESSRLGTQSFFTISVPLYDRNTYAGSIIQYMPWKSLMTLIDTVNFDEHGFAYISDRSGGFSTYPDPVAIGFGRRLDSPMENQSGRSRVTETEKRFLAGESGSGKYRHSGTAWLIGFAPIPGTNWSIGITTSQAEVLRHVWVMDLLYGLLIILMLIATKTYYSRRVLLQSEKDDAIMRLQSANEKLETQSAIISTMAERRINESENQYQDLFEKMSSGAILHEMILDADGTPVNYRYLSINSMAEKMFHLDKNEIIGKTFRDVNPDAQEETIRKMNEVAFNTAPTRLPDFRTSDGLAIRNTAYSPKPGLFVTLYDDITEEVRAKESLEIEREKLIKATNAAEAANLAKGKFLANMSHEIRTPLTAIIGLADVEIETRAEPLTIRTFTAIRESAKNLMSLLNDILDYSKMEAGKLTLDRKNFSLEEVINNALTVTAPRLSGKRVNMLVDFDPSLPELLVGDPVRLWQILKNLLDNAVKFTEEGQILLKVQNLGESLIQFTVTDTGCGIEQGVAERLFEVFEQGSSDLARRTGGTGLGLSITKQLVEMMNGTIQAQSVPRMGTTFTVILPLEAATASNSGFSLPKEAAILEGKRIIVADDDPNARLIIKGILDKSGAIAECVTNGEDAIARIIRDEAEGVEYDLVVLDLLLPGLNGIETANELSLSLHYKPRLILVTAWSKNFSVDEIMNAGFSETIDKPFVPSTVIRKIAYVLGKAEQGDEHDRTNGRNQYPDAKILVAEDNPQNRDVINRMLFLFGIRPDIAINGFDAIEKAKTNKYDLVFMDIQMPEMNGLEATKLIRSAERERNDGQTPIVAMTAYAMAEDIQESLNVGMDAHISKPIDMGMLKNTLEKYISAKRASGDKDPAAGETSGKPEGAALSALECVNTEEGLVRLGHDVKLYTRLLISLRDMLERPQPEFETAMSGDTINATAKFIHTLKGISGNLSVTELYRITSEIESDLRTHKPERRKYEKYRDICGQVFAELDKKLAKKARKADRKKAVQEGTEEELQSLLDSIIAPLEDGDAFAVDAILEALRSKKFKKVTKKAMDEISRLAMLFDYESILEQIRNFR